MTAGRHGATSPSVLRTLRNPDARALVRAYGGRVLHFRALPAVYKKAILARCDEVGGGEDLARKQRYGMALIPTRAFSEAVFKSEHDKVGQDFAAFHAWYMSRGGVPDHGVSVWPIEIDNNDGSASLIEDGWHRFNSYVHKRLKQVPIYWMVFPDTEVE